MWYRTQTRGRANCIVSEFIRTIQSYQVHLFSLERRKMSRDRKSRGQADVWCVAGALEGRPAIEERDQWRARPTRRSVLETHMCWHSNSWLLPIKRFGATTP